MTIVNLTEATFNETVTQPGITLVDWWADWCTPCNAFAPVYEAAADRHPDVTFAKVDTEAEPGLAQAAQIRGIPTIMVFRDGVMLFSESGAMPGDFLDELISKIQDLDMDKIHEALAAEARATNSSGAPPAPQTTPSASTE